MDQLSTVFTEAFTTRLLPLYHEVTIAALKAMNMAAYPQAAVVAGIAALLASVLLYGIGIWLRRMPERVSTADQQERIAKLRGKAQEWLPWLLILSPTPIGGVLIIAAGFFRIPPVKAALAIFAAEVLWRASPYIN